MATLGAVRADNPGFRLALDQIGGGRVVRDLNMGGKRIRTGTMLSREQILAINPANRASLIGRFIAVWPQTPETGNASTAGGGAERAERHVVSLGFGRFRVFEGIDLTPEPVTRAEAYALAGKPEPSK